MEGLDCAGHPGISWRRNGVMLLLRKMFCHCRSHWVFSQRPTRFDNGDGTLAPARSSRSARSGTPRAPSGKRTSLESALSSPGLEFAVGVAIATVHPPLPGMPAQPTADDAAHGRSKPGHWCRRDFARRHAGSLLIPTYEAWRHAHWVAGAGVPLMDGIGEGGGSGCAARWISAECWRTDIERSPTGLTLRSPVAASSTGAFIARCRCTLWPRPSLGWPALPYPGTAGPSVARAHACALNPGPLPLDLYRAYIDNTPRAYLQRHNWINTWLTGALTLPRWVGTLTEHYTRVAPPALGAAGRRRKTQ